MTDINMTEIARLAGVSKPTVSRVLNNQQMHIRQETREKVLKVVRELNYRPNFFAKSLKVRKTHCIGLIGRTNLSAMVSIYFSKIGAGIDRELTESKSEYSLTMSTSNINESYDKSIRLVEQGLFDGLILNIFGQDLELFENQFLPVLSMHNIPFVVVHSTFRDYTYNNVGLDNYSGGYEVGKHFIQLGYKDIGYYLRRRDTLRITEPLEGLKQACSDHNISFDDSHIIEPIYEKGVKKSQHSLAWHTFKKIEQLPRAIFVTDDTDAYGALKGLDERGVRVPEDVAVVGYDDVNVFHAEEPGLTTLHHPFEEKGAEATRMLSEILDGKLKRDTIHKIIIKPHLVVRKTCGGRR